ncbi:hypothetical protein GCM10009557_34610 [Virgisporangium ochraceum]|uniref:Mobilization protein n=1 Tax=Virgisporangium ochraceum TaxID=65505 RepID=A0A8J3ZUV9_9ACTN|nr:hypothetical protein [Virgisporangium ochraceum]GIJ67925.1 hypothetical protein Voc01_028420 [Virgisporangium ochraceum]
MEPGTGGKAPRGIDRRHLFPGRQRRINLRLDPDEHHDITTAAIRAGLTPSGYCADASLAAARGTTHPAHPVAGVDITWAELASLQRDLFAARTAATDLAAMLGKATDAINTVDQAPPWLGDAVHHAEAALGRIDSVVDRIDQRLR